MQTAKRRPEAGVIANLLAQPYRFQFVQAVRVLLIVMRQNGVPCDRALRQFLRFQNSLSLAFPSSEIEALEFDGGAHGRDDETVAAAFSLEVGRRVRITPAFIGLLGVSGTMPLHYTEQAAAHEQQQRDESMRAYLDIFSNHMVAQFFRAWGKYRIEHSLDVRGRDEFLPLLMDMSGTSSEAFGSRASGRGTGGVDSGVAGFYAGLLRQRPVSLAALECVLPDYFGVPMTIEQFVGAWDDIVENRQCQLGGPNAVLGYSGALGERIWRHDLRIRLRIGPLDKDDFERFLPGAAAALALETMIALFGVPGLLVETQLILHRESVEPAVLVAGDAKGSRLGWDSYLGDTPPSEHQDDVRFLLRLT